MGERVYVTYGEENVHRGEKVGKHEGNERLVEGPTIK